MKKSLREQYEAYIAPFFSKASSQRNEDLSANLLLKKEHTERVLGEALLLAAALKLPERDRRIAGAAALLHDISRFPQYAQYGTFRDSESRDHGDWSCQIVKDEEFWEDPLPPEPPAHEEEGQIILEAIRWHNKRVLPADLPEKTALHCRLLRDADKIDILHVATLHSLDPHGIVQETAKNQEQGGSRYRELLRAFLEGENIDNRLVETALDQHILMLTWLNDLNFPLTRQRIAARDLASPLVAMIPSEDDRRAATERVQQLLSCQDG